MILELTIGRYYPKTFLFVCLLQNSSLKPLHLNDIAILPNQHSESEEKRPTESNRDLSESKRTSEHKLIEQQHKRVVEQKETGHQNQTRTEQFREHKCGNMEAGKQNKEHEKGRTIEYENKRNSEQQALLNQVSQKHSNEIELSYKETKQHKDTKYKSCSTQKLNKEEKYREQENENNVNFEIHSCSRSLNESVLEKDFVCFSDDSESDIEILSSSIIQVFENDTSEITHAAATTSMADINVMQSNIVERKEKKNPPQLMLEVMDEVYENESPKNDSGIQIEKSLTVEDTDSEVDETNDGPVNVRDRLKATEIKKKHPKEKTKYKKPPRPCLFCKTNQTKLKRHILGRHKDEALVKPLLDMNAKEQDRQIAQLRKQAIRKFNIEMINHGETCFMRERRSLKNNKNSESNMPVMCSGCKGFYCKSYKS